MGAGIGVILIAIGAVLRYAVTESHWEDLDLNVTGMVLMIVGIIALLWTVILYLIAHNGNGLSVERHDSVVDKTPTKTTTTRRRRTTK